MNNARYLKWLAALCAVIACFGVAVLCVGYKPPSFGRIATIVVLLLAAAALIWHYRRKQA